MFPNSLSAATHWFHPLREAALGLRLGSLSHPSPVSFSLKVEIQAWLALQHE